jgi:hypothetical protein
MQCFEHARTVLETKTARCRGDEVPFQILNQVPIIYPDSLPEANMTGHSIHGSPVRANRFKRFCFKMFSWVLVVSTYVEIFLRREHLNRLFNVNLLYCGKSSYKGFIFMTLIIVGVLSAIFCHLVTKKKLVKLIQSILWKEYAKAARFWGFFLFQIAIFGQ